MTNEQAEIEAEIVCAICDDLTDADYYCPGCQEYICDEHGDGPLGPHYYLAHDEDADDEDDDDEDDDDDDDDDDA